MKKTLLLSASFEVLSFIDIKKAIKLIVKDKAEIINHWEDETIIWSSGSLEHPAILKLKTPFRRNFYNAAFSRKALIKRDESKCQYCGIKLTPSQITIDHIKPRVQGGGNSFTNCVVSCQACNSKKGEKTLEQAEMQLLKRPTHPSFIGRYGGIEEPKELHWHETWDQFLNY